MEFQDLHKVRNSKMIEATNKKFLLVRTEGTRQALRKLKYEKDNNKNDTDGAVIEEEYL